MEDTKYQFTISPKAIEQIKKKFTNRDTLKTLRLGVKSGGCSGYSYVISFEDTEPRSKDIIFNFEDVKVVIDNKSIIYLNQSTLDWKNTLMYTGYIFINPAEKSKCGCGKSIQF